MSNFNNMLGIPQGMLGSPINCVVSASSGSFTTASSSAVDVTNLSCQIASSGDYPLHIRLIPDGSTSSSQILCGSSGGTGTAPECHVYILRNGTVICDFYQLYEPVGTGNPSVCVPVSSVSTLDFPTKGMQTYKVQVKCNAGGGTPEVRMYNAKLVVYEDRSLIYK